MTNFRDVAPEPPETGRDMATIVDVANAAGVSPSTVSYVITGKRPISPRTRRRVEESIRTLGYRRHDGSPAARATRVGVLAISAPARGDRHLDLEMEFFSAAAATARGLHFDLLLITRDEGTSGLHRVLAGALADAAIVLDVGGDDPRVPILLASGRPAVLIGAPGPFPGLARVDLDFSAAGEACLTHLADLGHRSIAVLEPPPVPGRRVGFLEGFTAGATRRKVSKVSRRCAPSPEAVTRCLDELLTPGGPTGLIVQDEAALPWVLAALERRGRRVPEDISLVAICSETMAGRQRLRPTAVIVPARRLGALAVERAVRQLDGEPAAEPELLTPLFVAGESTAAARPA